MKVATQMKTAVCLCLLLPALAAHATDGPDVGETLAYINARCVGSQWRVPADSDFVNQTLAISLSGTTLTHAKTFTLTSSREDSKYNHVSHYDLRKVEISWAAYPNTAPHIKLSCADVCVKWESWREGESKHNVSPVDGDSLYCRDGEKVYRAVKHLQDLLGGKEKDPFAN